MNPNHCQAHKLRDVRLSGWQEKIAGRWHYRDLAADPTWRHGWISFDSLAIHPGDGQLYCGLNSLDGDLLYRFDPATKKFTSLNTQRWTNAFDSKIHRTLLVNPHDGCLYFATSLLHDADQQREAPGGKLVRYDPQQDRYDVLGIPFPHLYVQSIAADWDRGLIYAFTYPAELLMEFNLHTRQSRVLGYVGNAISFAQPHNAVVDHTGALWGTYAETRAWDETPGTCPIRLFRYHPEQGFTFFNHGLSRRDETDQLLPDPPKRYEIDQTLTETRHRQDWGFCDGMVFDGSRYLYAGTVAGVLSRIDTQNGEVRKIAHVMPAGRLPALAIRDGVLYAGGGMKGRTQVVRWKIGSQKIEDFGELSDPATGDRPARIHELAVGPDGTVYLAENDNHTRSSYLWSVTGPPAG